MSNSRDKKDNKFNTIKFIVQFEVYPDTLQKHSTKVFKGIRDIQEAIEHEVGWLEQSGIYMNQIRVKR